MEQLVDEAGLSADENDQPWMTSLYSTYALCACSALVDGKHSDMLTFPSVKKENSTEHLAYYGCYIIHWYIQPCRSCFKPLDQEK